jgi:hypothetical protein
LFLFFYGLSNSQTFIYPQDYFFDSENQRNILMDSNRFELHQSIKPICYASRIYGQRNEDYFKADKKLIGRKIFNEDFIELKHTDYQSGWPRKFVLNASPVFNFQGGINLQDTSREKLYINSRGIILKGAIDDKFYFESVFVENQATFPKYIDDFANKYSVIPGSGRWKKFKTNGYDFAYASGFILYSPNKYFSIQAGNGKHHLGNGYRSLLLSDNAFNYPYLRFNSKFFKGKIQYTSIYASLMNLTSGNVLTPIGTERLFQKKPAGFHHLSLNLGKYLNLGLFQSLIWSKSDSLNRTNLNAAFFNPLIFSNLAVYGFEDSKNIMTGIDLSIRPFKGFMIYGQFVLDEKGQKNSISNKYGYQLGLRYFDVLGLKNLFMSAELNTVRPFTYSATDAGQAYTHYNQSLAHPLGANFKEIIGILNYSFKRAYINVKVIQIKQGLNLGSNYGQDIFISDFNSSLNSQAQNQGIQSETSIVDLKLGYLINPKNNMTIYAGIMHRERNVDISGGVDKTEFIYFGVQTALFNNYFDF